MTVSAEAKFNVGGVLLDQPFKIRRLGHFGLNFYDLGAAVHFYKDLLGFKITDIRTPHEVPEEQKGWGDLNRYFMRYASDHHAFVLYNQRQRLAIGRTTDPTNTINQITWQAGSLAEVVNGNRWLVERGEQVMRAGRDMPGSNWHVYLNDPDGHQNEIYYGIEQIGWTGHSKPWSMHGRDFDVTPELPQISEYAEVNEALARGDDLLAGFRDEEKLPLVHDVDGILLARPFKIVKLGPVSLFVADVERAEAWYRDILGFTPTETATYQGHRCVFLRNNTEHHSLALYPLALRSVLGLREETSTMAIGVQVANYRQLLDAMGFLKSHGVTLQELPPELTPGLDHTILARDPDGHAVQFYWSMEQIGWEGKPKPAHLRRAVTPGAWPGVLPANSDSYQGEPLLGPWG